MPRRRSTNNETKDDLDTNFTGTILWTDIEVNRVEWILDSRANDHMTCLSHHLFHYKTLKKK